MICSGILTWNGPAITQTERTSKQFKTYQWWFCFTPLFSKTGSPCVAQSGLNSLFPILASDSTSLRLQMCTTTLLSVGLIPKAWRNAWGITECWIMKVQRKLKRQASHLVPLSSFPREQTDLYKSHPRTHPFRLTWLWHDPCLPEGSVKKPSWTLASTISHCSSNCLHEVPLHQKPYRLNVQFKIRRRSPPGHFISSL